MHLRFSAIAGVSRIAATGFTAPVRVLHEPNVRSAAKQHTILRLTVKLVRGDKNQGNEKEGKDEQKLQQS